MAVRPTNVRVESYQCSCRQHRRVWYHPSFTILFGALSMLIRTALCHLTKTRHNLQRACSAPYRPATLHAHHRLLASVNAAELSFGQPVHETHPHLLQAGERTVFPLCLVPISLTPCSVTPGITALEYAERRSKLAAKLPERAIAIVVASDTKYRAGNVFYEFHQDPDFFYLTGERF